MPGRGFTLLEVVVSASLMAVLVTALLGLSAVALERWGAEADDVELSARASLVLDLLEEDLASAVVRQDGRSWFAVGSEPVTNAPSGHSSQSLRFFSEQQRRDGSREVQAIGYWLEWVDPTGGGEAVFAVMRRTFDGSSTLEQFTLAEKNGMDGGIGVYRDLEARSGPLKEFLAAGVIALSFRLYARDQENGKWIWLNENTGSAKYPWEAAEMFQDEPAQDGSNRFPERIQIQLWMLEGLGEDQFSLLQEEPALLAELEGGRFADLGAFLLARSRVFGRDVVLPQKGF